MLRNLLDEMMRRRLLPFAALAVLVAIIVPLLFLKGAPDDAPSADSAAPAAAEAAKLPARAARLLAATDAGASRGGAKGTAHDPFNPPALVPRRGRCRQVAPRPAAKAAGGRRPAKSTGSARREPVPVVITDDGNEGLVDSRDAGASSKSNSSSSSSTTTRSRSTSATAPRRTRRSAARSPATRRSTSTASSSRSS